MIRLLIVERGVLLSSELPHIFLETQANPCLYLASAVVLFPGTKDHSWRWQTSNGDYGKFYLSLSQEAPGARCRHDELHAECNQKCEALSRQLYELKAELERLRIGARLHSPRDGCRSPDHHNGDCSFAAMARVPCDDMFHTTNDIEYNGGRRTEPQVLEDHLKADHPRLVKKLQPIHPLGTSTFPSEADAGAGQRKGSPTPDGRTAHIQHSAPTTAHPDADHAKMMNVYPGTDSAGSYGGGTPGGDDVHPRGGRGGGGYGGGRDHGGGGSLEVAEVHRGRVGKQGGSAPGTPRGHGTPRSQGTPREHGTPRKQGIPREHGTPRKAPAPKEVKQSKGGNAQRGAGAVEGAAVGARVRAGAGQQGGDGGKAADAAGQGGVGAAAGKKGSRKILPPSQRYNFYRYYGFAGQGAKTSRGWNPK